MQDRRDPTTSEQDSMIYVHRTSEPVEIIMEDLLDKATRQIPNKLISNIF